MEYSGRYSRTHLDLRGCIYRPEGGGGDALFLEECFDEENRSALQAYNLTRGKIHQGGVPEIFGRESRRIFPRDLHPLEARNLVHREASLEGRIPSEKPSSLHSWRGYTSILVKIGGLN
ncbi:MAG: hypothetical protein Q8P81_04270 [Nanoarchaeota archaeon]|nr:hypothetical protein [Nanoarchaeota archaeon]